MPRRPAQMTWDAARPPASAAAGRQLRRPRCLPAPPQRVGDVEVARRGNATVTGFPAAEASLDGELCSRGVARGVRRAGPQHRSPLGETRRPLAAGRSASAKRRPLNRSSTLTTTRSGFAWRRPRPRRGAPSRAKCPPCRCGSRGGPACEVITRTAKRSRNAPRCDARGDSSIAQATSPASSIRRKVTACRSIASGSA